MFLPAVTDSSCGNADETFPRAMPCTKNSGVVLKADFCGECLSLLLSVSSWFKSISLSALFDTDAEGPMAKRQNVIWHIQWDGSHINYSYKRTKHKCVPLEVFLSFLSCCLTQVCQASRQSFFLYEKVPYTHSIKWLYRNQANEYEMALNVQSSAG